MRCRHISLHIVIYSCFCVGCGRGAGDSGCGVPRTFATYCGRTEVKQGPADGASCMWDILVESGQFINLTFTQFDIQDTGMF